MAEGDTIRRTAERIGGAFADQPLVAAEAPNVRSPLRRQAAALASLVGRRLARADAHGKHLFLRFDGGLTLHCHQGMSGSWRVRTPGDEPHRRSAPPWARLATARAEAVQFGGPRLVLRTEAQLASDPALRALGPDVLGDRFSPEEGVRALRTRAASERQLGDALLDQRTLAGIGNVYKAEACFAAGLSPWRRLAELDDEELHRVVVEAAGLMRAGLATGRRPRDVYRRAGRPCPRCGTQIRSRGQGDANRTTYWCPACQP